MVGNSLLLILNPRELPTCLMGLERLECPKVWLSYFTEWELRDVIAEVIRVTDYERYTIISDDCVVCQAAYDDVVQLHTDLGGEAVTTGFCNLDLSSEYVNITTEPFQDSRPPDEGSYRWWTLDEVRNWDEGEPVPSGFAGMSFTCMSKEQWQQFPWDCYGAPRGWAADYHLALRLRDAGVPIFAPKTGFVFHTKKNWLDHSTNERTKILVGQRPAEVRWDLG